MRVYQRLSSFSKRLIPLSTTELAASFVALLILLLGVSMALTLDSDFGKIEVTTVPIGADGKDLSGLLYKPRSADATSPAPSFVIAHGISGSKEMMSSIGLELARRGFVSLCLDLYGHGESQGSVTDGRADRTFGVYSAVQYLKSQLYVNSSSLGLVGHSLGAGAVMATVTREPEIDVVILIAGGLGDAAEDPEHEELNSTFPKNLLVLVGEYDVLFDTKELMIRELPGAFGISSVVSPGVVYGDFAAGTARKLVIPLTTHLFEVVDSTVISEIVAWAESTFGKGQNGASGFSAALTYPQRETVILIALVGLVGTICALFFPVAGAAGLVIQTRTLHERTRMHRWKLYAAWGIINLVLFFPMLAVGSAIGFPPVLFGSSIAWWMLVSGLAALLVLSRFPGRIIGEAFSLKQVLKDNFNKKEVLGASVTFVLILALVGVLASSFNFTFRIISPIFRNFSSVSRLLVFPVFVPFFLLFFVSEGLLVHELSQPAKTEKRLRGDVLHFGETGLAKALPFAVLLGVNYILRILFGFWVLPGFVGFLMEFLWLILPVLMITTSISWWFYRKTTRIAYGALLNALLMSWVASVVFPF